MGSNELKEKAESLIKLIQEDKNVAHCRINVINGVSDVFQKYKQNLKYIENTETISVRFYKGYRELHDDLFSDKHFMEPNWFNLFVFNINYCRHVCDEPECENYNTVTSGCKFPLQCEKIMCCGSDENGNQITVKDHLIKEIKGINTIWHELKEKFDSKYYSLMIASLIDLKDIIRIFETATGEKCPLTCLRYISYDFDGTEIMEYLKKNFYTHSTKFLVRWSNALDKLASFQNIAL